MNTDHKLHTGALEIAIDVQNLDHTLIDRADARDGSIHVVPNQDMDVSKKEEVEAAVEPLIEEYPFTISEWWYDRDKRESQLVVSPYWPGGGQLSTEQLDQYDEFIEDMGE